MSPGRSVTSVSERTSAAPSKGFVPKNLGIFARERFSRNLLLGITEVSAEALKPLSLKALSAYPLRMTAPGVGGNSGTVIPA
jgi:hypothetical protein